MSLLRRGVPRNALFALLALLAASRAVPATPAGKGWRVARLDELAVYSQVSDGKTRDIVEEVARFRAVLARLSLGNGEAPVPIRLFLFESSRAYDPFKPPAMEKKSTGGHFQVSPFGHLLALNAYPERGSALPVVFHEYVHEYLHSHYSDLPLWMDEGLAEFYGTFRVAGGEAQIGLPQADELRWMREHAFIPLTRLFVIDHRSPEYQKGEERSTLYAESWLLTHYLMVGLPDGGPRLGRFRALLAGGAPLEQAFRESFGMSMAELEGHLRGYLRAHVLSYLRLPLAELPLLPAIALADVPPAEALFRLSTLLVRAREPEAAKAADRMALDALALDPASGDAVLVRAVIAGQAGRDAEARALFDRAAALEPRDPAGCFLLARNLLERTGDARAAERARAILRRALAAHPGYAEAQAALGYSGLAAQPAPTPEQLTEAISWLEKATRTLPGRADFARLLVQAQVAAGQLDRAKETLALLPGDAVAAAAVAREERMQAVNAALAAGNADEALRLMRAAVKEEPDATAQRALGEQLVKLEAQVAERLALYSREQEERDAFNQALAAARAGRLAEARDVARKLVATARSPQVVDAAKGLLADLEKLPKR